MEIKRDKYLNNLIARMHNGLIKVVTGIRRCEKNTDSYAAIDFASYTNATANSLWFRLRANKDDSYATGLYGIMTACRKYPTYLSGYGKEDSKYYIKIQTDSNSPTGASTSGTWRP